MEVFKTVSLAVSGSWVSIATAEPPTSFWDFLLYFTLSLLVLHLVLGPRSVYISTIGYLALSVEAILPIPQMLANHRARSCEGFRISVLLSWLLGDVLKMMFFFFAERPIPWAFKVCGIFQFACDLYLGAQYWVFGAGPTSPQGLPASARDVSLHPI